MATNQPQRSPFQWWSKSGEEIHEKSISFREIGSSSPALFVPVLGIATFVWYVISCHVQKPPQKIAKKQRRPVSKAIGICPFSKKSEFEIECADQVPLSPLELFDDEEEWPDNNINNNETTYKPLAAKWLQAGISGQDTPGILRAGLKRMRDSRHFLIQDGRQAHELGLKQKAFDSQQRHDQVFVAELDSLQAQQECLELFLDYLPKRYPSLYHYDKNKNIVTVKSIGTTFDLNDDWVRARPLELCARMVQEDLVLMRPSQNKIQSPNITEKEDKTTTRSNSLSNSSYHMAAAAVVFSFDQLNERLGQTSQFIHVPVPGFDRHVLKTLHLTFDRLQPQELFWRNNWGFAPNGLLDDPARLPREFSLSEQWLEVEYQTIRRLPRTRFILFTVRTFMDPLHELSKVPQAAACLAASIRGMSAPVLKYKGIQTKAIQDEVLAYLDSISITVPLSPKSK